MIVVGLLGSDARGVAEIARRAAAGGSSVELVGLVPGDSTWDKALFDLAQAGVGHATVVRSGRASMEAADLELALRYLPDIRCVVMAAPPARLIETAIAGADYGGAPLVIVGPLDAESLAELERRGPNGSGEAPVSSTPIVLDAPADDPDATFAGFVAALANRLDRGEPPDLAFRSTVAALAVDPA